jgi:hypothetical protein
MNFSAVSPVKPNHHMTATAPIKSRPVPDNSEGIPVSRWGKDHWSLLAYVESLVVDAPDKVGTVNRQRVRCNPGRHPLLQGTRDGIWQPNYGTRLAGFFEYAQRTDLTAAETAGFFLPEHDDWDCLDDLDVANLVETLSLINGKVLLTPVGSVIAAQLRLHKQQGGQFANFTAPNLFQSH